MKWRARWPRRAGASTSTWMARATCAPRTASRSWRRCRSSSVSAAPAAGALTAAVAPLPLPLHLSPSTRTPARSRVRRRAAGRRRAGAVPCGGAAAQAAAAVQPGAGAPRRQGGQRQLAAAGLHSARGAPRGTGEPRLPARAASTCASPRSWSGAQGAWGACCCSSEPRAPNPRLMTQEHAPYPAPAIPGAAEHIPELCITGDDAC